MNFELAKEIYGSTPWFIDQQTLPSLFGIVDSLQNGVILEAPEIKYNSCQVVSQSDSKLITRQYQLNNSEDFSAIGLINLNGPITVGGGASSCGMREQADVMLTMSKDSRVKSFIILADSGGGSTAAVEIMVNAIKTVRETKDVIGLVREGGVAASACYGILSACSKIYAESEMSIVGSAGTMIQFSGREANSEDENGVKHIRLYATKSTEKNKAFEEAINNDNYELIYSKLLNPINERFLTTIQENRPILKNTNFDNGHTLFAKDAVGTFIDGIKTFSEVFSIATEETENNTNLKTEKMTIQELQSNHPEVYTSIFNAGIDSERDRAGAWMAHSETDLPAVKKGIESGEAISATSREGFLVKAASLSHLKNLEEESTEEVIETEESEEEVVETEADTFYKEVNKKLNSQK